MRVLLAPILLAAASLGSAAQASTASWFVRVEASSSIVFSRGETKPAFSLVPQRVFELSTDATPAGWKFPVPRGTLFVEVDGSGSGKFCGMARHLGSAFHCLADRDRDGTVESYYYQQVFNEFYFGSKFGEEGQSTLQSPALLRELDPFSQIAPIALGLRYAGGKPGGKIRFKLCVEEPSGSAHWQKGLYKTCLNDEYLADPESGTLDLLGITGRVTALDDKRISIAFPSNLRIVPVTFNGTKL